LKTYTGIKGDSGIRRNDTVADVMPADAGISTNKQGITDLGNFRLTRIFIFDMFS